MRFRSVNKMNRDVALRLYLDKIETAIAAHPLASEPVLQSFEAIKRHGQENAELISEELEARGLPSLDELGKLQVRHGFSWARLPRKRKTLRNKLHLEICPEGRGPPGFFYFHQAGTILRHSFTSDGAPAIIWKESFVLNISKRTQSAQHGNQYFPVLSESIFHFEFSPLLVFIASVPGSYTPSILTLPLNAVVTSVAISMRRASKPNLIFCKKTESQIFHSTRLRPHPVCCLDTKAQRP